MKLSAHDAIAAAGICFFCCLGWAMPFINPHHHWIYHEGSSPALVFVPVLCNVFAVWLLWCGLLLLGRRPGWTRGIVWSGVLCLLPWMLLKDALLLGQWRMPHRASMSVLLSSALCWVAFAALWRPGYAARFENVQRAIAALLEFAGPCFLLVVGLLLLHLWKARSLLQPRALHARTVETVQGAKKPRIVWIILDELSYRQVYEHRFASLQLPAFDALAQQATVFTQVVPAANSTELAVPSMLTGYAVDHLRLNGEGALKSLHDPEARVWRPFRPADTIFADALSSGYSTAIAGWYNPYCRIMPEVLDGCYWYFREGDGGGIWSDASMLTNLAAPWRHVIESVALLPSGTRSSDKSAGPAHVADYVAVSSAADRFLEDSTLNFLLLHIPAPHPGGIYDRQARAMTPEHGSYIDNLALADSYLGHVHALLEQRGEWDSSAVIVMGDHSWRTQLLWKGSPMWTAEDEAASEGGKFDDRPGYIVKLPYQATGAHIDARFAAVRTRALLRCILDGSIRSAAELQNFAAAQP